MVKRSFVNMKIIFKPWDFEKEIKESLSPTSPLIGEFLLCGAQIIRPDFQSRLANVVLEAVWKNHSKAGQSTKEG